MNGANVQVYSLANDGNKKLSANFAVKEFRCYDGTDTIFVSSELVKLLQKVREHFGKPVNINSAYRTEAHNKKNGGATYSKHKYGLAADISISGVSPIAVAHYVETLLPSSGGIGVYQSFTHIDVRTNRVRFDCRSGKQITVKSW